MENNFSIFVPINTIEKGTDKNGKETMIIGGIVSDELVGPDLDGEVIEVDGMDLTKFMQKGFLNWNHLSSKDPSSIIGEPISFEKNNGKLFVKSQLYSDSEMARKVYDLANTLSKNSSSRKMSYSIEGTATQRDEKNPKRIKKSSISGLAVCTHPKNHGAELTVIKGEVNYETQEGSNFLIDITDENGTRWTVDKNLSLEKSETNTLEKGGEGSKGGRVIGHTKSGKAIYLHENDSDSTSAGSIHAGKFKGWSKEDHMDAMKAHTQAKQDIHKKWHSEHAEHIERTGSGSGFKPANASQEEKDRMNHMHNNDAHYYQYVVKHGGNRTDAYDATNTPYDASKKDEINKREIRKSDNDFILYKAMEAGSITGTETHNQSLTQEPLKVESVAGGQGKKKKNYKKLLVNLRKRRGETNEEADEKYLTKSEILTHLLDEYDLDIQSAKRVYQLAEAIEKNHAR